MKICHMTSAHPPADQRIYHKMCQSLAEAGHEVHLVAAGGHHDAQPTTGRVRLHLVPAAKCRAGRMLRTTRAVMKLAGALKADLYQFHDPELLPGAVRFQRRVRAPVVYDVHEDYRAHMEKPWLPTPLRGIAASAVGYFEDKTVRRLAGVVSATPHIAERFDGHAHSVVVRNFPVIEEFPAVQGDRKHRVGDFAYVGRIMELRGARQMIEALQIAGPNAHLCLAGDWAPKTLRSECTQQPEWSQVEDVGFLGRKELATMLSESQAGLVLLHPIDAYWHSYPVKLFEYMAAELPVIASDFPLWREIVAPAECGILIDPLDTKAIAAAMTWIMEHPAEATAMGKRGREAVLAHYNWQGESEKLLQLYHDLRK